MKYSTVRFGKFFYKTIAHIWNIHLCNAWSDSTVQFCIWRSYIDTFENNWNCIALKNTMVFIWYKSHTEYYRWIRHKIDHIFGNCIENGVMKRFDEEKNDWPQKRYPCTIKENILVAKTTIAWHGVKRSGFEWNRFRTLVTFV